MQRRLFPIALLFAAACMAIVAWGSFGASAEESTTVRVVEDRTSKMPNLSLWVPEEELQVWDPVNPNVNPVPWRVFGPIDDEERSAAFRHTAIDQRVRVEGLAWGYESRAEVPTSRVVFEGGTVLVDGVDFNKPEIRGKSVRVIGVLRLRSFPHRGFERQFPNYYCIESESFEVIDQVADPKVVRIK